MRQIASIEVRVLVRELQGLVGMHLDNFYDLGNSSFRFLFTAKGKKEILFCKLLTTINLTKFIEEGEATSFAIALKKRIRDLRLSAVSQKDLDRVIVMDFAGKESYKLVIEMFGKGNLILLDSEEKINLIYQGVKQKDRTLVSRVKYEFPKSSSIKEFQKESAKEIIEKAAQEKETVIKALSKYVDIGPLYLEDIIVRAGLLPKDSISSVIGKESSLEKQLQEFFYNSENPSPTIYKENGNFKDYSITPILKYQSLEHIKFESLSALLDELYLNERKRTNADESRVNEAKISIERQEKNIKELEMEEIESNKAGHAIFQKMHRLNEAIEYIKKNKKASIEQLQAAFPDLGIKSIDFKDKKFIIQQSE